ncbi:putative ABC transport system permease protein [Nocardioides thalensis]|uniref:Putative ABC transport system permease protein n=1 Tax=Nocardioides thalensis TaxID=1914755 RepID=A0A853BVX5_9ACTN|nr:ABC transporter permease [Nocardioides thalensis]NYI99428.1 putative ABC transport system permease protein [Nocardioides thalensis]
MRTVLLASLRVHARRYVAALLAVAIGVAFVVVTAALSSAARDGLVAGLDEPYAGADVVVDKPPAEDAVRLLDEAAGHDADAWLVGWTMQPVARDGTVLDAEADIAQVPDPADRRWQLLEDGRFPERSGEALVDDDAARAAGVVVGDRLTIGTGDRALDVEVVGLAESPSAFSSAAVWLRWDDLVRWEDSLYVSSVAWAGPGDHDAEVAVVEGIARGGDALTVADFVRRVQKEVNNGVDVARIVLLVFATIALTVAVIVINNTFAILFAQRARDLALLRCVGATRRQLVRAVRLESLALGVVAAAVGAVAGLGAGHGLVALVRSAWPDVLLGRAEVGAGWVLGAAAVGIAVTLLAASLPTRRVAGMSPLAALRPDDSASVATGTGRRRLAAGVATVATGFVLLVLSVVAHALPALLVGGVVTFAGVLVLGPVLVPGLIRAAGTALRRVLGPAGRLAGVNAVRNPRRTAATAASLLIGVTLTTAVLTGTASARGALDGLMDRDHPIDVAVTSPAANLPDDVLTGVLDTPGVEDAVAIRGVVAEVEGADGPVTVLAPEAGEVTHSPVLATDDRQLRVSRELAADLPRRVTMRVGDREQELRVVGDEGFGDAALVTPATLAELTATPELRAVWVRATDGADGEELGSMLTALARSADVENGLVKREYVDLQLDVMTGSIVGLLAVAVVIALVGIANTLGLSVLERGREHALLRALGLTRRQLRTMLATEAVLLAVVATLLGTTLGVAFAGFGVEAMIEPVAAGADLVLPGWQLALTVVIAAVAGLVACVLPARRAARVAPAAGLALD